MVNFKESIMSEVVCRSCGAPIAWQRTKLGKMMPVNVRFIVGLTEQGDTVRVRESHFATCPNANKHRQEKVLPAR
jgi:hypothetical protein